MGGALQLGVVGGLIRASSGVNLSRFAMVGQPLCEGKKDESWVEVLGGAKGVVSSSCPS